METINDRFNAVLKASGLSQEAFAKSIKRGRGEISNIVYGKTTPKDSLVDAICEKFNVSETWLRTGQGEMHLPKSKEEQIAELVGQALTGSNEFKKAVIQMICSRTEKELQVLEAALRSIYENL